MRSSRWPAWPAKGWPCSSSSLPGASPTIITRASRDPRENTVLRAVRFRAQPSKASIWDLSASSVSALAASSGAEGPSDWTCPKPAARAAAAVAGAGALAASRSPRAGLGCGVGVRRAACAGALARDGLGRTIGSSSGMPASSHQAISAFMARSWCGVRGGGASVMLDVYVNVIILILGACRARWVFDPTV